MSTFPYKVSLKVIWGQTIIFTIGNLENGLPIVNIGGMPALLIELQLLRAVREGEVGFLTSNINISAFMLRFQSLGMHT